MQATRLRLRVSSAKNHDWLQAKDVLGLRRRAPDVIVSRKKFNEFYKTKLRREKCLNKQNNVHTVLKQ